MAEIEDAAADARRDENGEASDCGAENEPKDGGEDAMDERRNLTKPASSPSPSSSTSKSTI